MSDVPKVGFVGVGTIAEALINGLCANGERRADILLSPRNAQIVERLTAAHDFIRVPADNQAVVDDSDIVLLAVRPQVADEVLAPLTFRADQRIVSLIATYDVARLAPLVSPATAIARAVPLPPVARREGAMTLYPPIPEIVKLLGGLGQLVPLEREADMDICLAVTALMGSYFGMLEGISDWLVRGGIGEDQARSYIGAIYHALGNTASAEAAKGFGQLSIDYSTPGGLNEQAWRELKAAGLSDLTSQALDLILARARGQATLDDHIPANRA